MLLGNAFAPDPRVHNEARGLVEGGYDVHILGWDRDGIHPLQETRDGIRVERIPVLSTHGRGATQVVFMLLFWIEAFRRVLRTRPLALHCHDFDTLPVGWLAGLLMGVPVVYDAHESYADLMRRSLPAAMIRLIERWERWHLRRVALAITVGDKLAARLREDGAARTEVVGNWKDPGRFEFSADARAQSRRELEIPEESLVICFVANLDTDRKVEELMEAAADLAGVAVIVGGDGPAGDLVRSFAGRCSNIRYLGYVKPARIPLLTATADVVYYGFDEANGNARYSAPNKLFEALAAGKALITGTFGEIGAMTEEHRLGFALAEFSAGSVRDAICSLRDNKEALSAMQERARELGAGPYSLAGAHRRLVAAYDRLASSSASTV